MTCEQATEAYKTARFTGNTDGRLYEHALGCPRRRYWHALPTSLYPSVDRERARAVHFSAWQAELGR